MTGDNSSIQVLVPEISHLRVLDRPAAAPHSLPVQAINALQFSPEQPAEHRVRIQGVVTLRRPTGTVFVADTTGGVPIEAENLIMPGDRVDVVGFPAQGGYLAVLENAVFQAEAVPAAASYGGGSALEQLPCAARPDGGYVLDRMTDSSKTLLTIQAGQHVFTAVLDARRTPVADGSQEWKPGPGHRRLSRGRREVDRERRPRLDPGFQTRPAHLAGYRGR